jgi:Prokaryotic homologs of the JAB domain
VSGWTRRTAGGAVWNERPVPGRPGVLERVYAESAPVFRLSPSPPQLAGPSSSLVGHERPAGSRRGDTSAPGLADRSNEVTFTQWAWEDLRNEIAECDGLEVGGGLFGSIRENGAVVVSHVLGPTWWTERSKYQINMEPARLFKFERPDQIWLGDWHTHDAPAAEPSEQDRRGWGSFVREKLGVYLGVIACPADTEDWRWANPTIRDWVNRREGGVTRCERAALDLLETSS